MILTLTPNAGLDRIVFIDEFLPANTMCPNKILDCVGGKGLNASMTLTTLGVDTLALSFVGGDTGRRLVQRLDAYGVKHDLVWVDGETRTYLILVEQRHSRQSNLILGELSVLPQDSQGFLQRYQTHVQEADWVIAAGSLPSGLPSTYYCTLIDTAREANTPILLDIRAASALATLPLKPEILKMNWAEFNQTFETTTKTVDDLKQQAQIVYKREALLTLVITCGAKGMLALTPEGPYHAISPPQQVVNPAGAGDAASATLAWRRSQGDTYLEALRWAAAVSAATVLTACTGESRRSDIDSLLKDIEVQRF